MREGHFIKNNKERWEGYQQPTDDPDEVAKRFTYLVEDLSYAKTFYPFSNTGRYINSIAAGIYLSIYKNKKEKSHRLITFWTTELPLIMYKHRTALTFAFVYFVLFCLIGGVSAATDQTFVRSIMGDGYVDMTEQNIASGDPFGVYKDMNPFIMFLFIAFNNIRVAMITFASGLLFSVGTLYFLFTNGIMMGAFEEMFIKHGLGTKFILVVFIHGTLELSAIIIAGAAGLILGNSLIFPKTYTRMQSFVMAAKDSVKIILGLVPVFITAAFFESYVTRHTGMPMGMSLIILAGSLSFILWYFVFLPILVHRKQKHLQSLE